MNPRPSPPLVAAALLVFLTGGVSLAEPALAIEPGTELEWPTTTGHTYQLQSATGPAGPWSDLGPAAPGDGTVATSYQPVPSGTFHYQVLETVPGSPPAPRSPVNGGFELGNASVAEHWTTGGGQPPVRTADDAHTGTHAMRCAITSAPAEGLLSQAVVAAGGAVLAGQPHDFSFRAKQISSGPSYLQEFELQWLNASGVVIGGSGVRRFDGGSGAWAEIALPAQLAPAGTVEARLKFRFVTGAVAGGHGEVLLDDIVLDSGEDPGSGSPPVTTAHPLAPRPVNRLSWSSTAGTPYQPAATTNLQSWTYPAPPVTGTGTTMDLTLPRSRTAEFYRLEFPLVVDPGVVPLFHAATIPEAPVSIDTADALLTYVADRARDRHAREDNFHIYDHYLSWYWEQRIANIEIVDRVGRNGGSDITFNYSTHDALNPAEFRTFFRGLNTVAEYHGNQIATLVSTTPSAIPGETDYNYSATINWNLQLNRALQVGDRVEFELSQFLAAPRNGRNNYYGTTMLYIVGQGIVPWAAGRDLGFDGGIVGSTNQSLDSYPLPESAWLGGKTTLPYQYSNEPEHRFKQTAGNISPTNGHPFMLGRRLHHTDFGSGAHSEPNNPVFTAQSGKLGPAYIARSCVACHTNNGRALPPAPGTLMLQTVLQVGSNADGAPHPTLGSVLQPRNTSGPAEGSAMISGYTEVPGLYGDGTPYTLRKPNYHFPETSPAFHSARLAPQLVGLGLLEALDESTIATRADPDDADADGISGRMQTVTDPETGEQRLGRFGHKARHARLSHQVAAALNTDLGIPTAVFPVLDGASSASTAELSTDELDQMTRYVALLGVAARRNLADPDALRGEQLFTHAHCAKCHVDTLVTGPHHPYSELRNQTIHPYTDLLLHDMGPGLADNMGEAAASGAEWRTPPLWNIGLTSGVSGGEAYLHDGRARTLEEAILWHGGEAEASKDTFRTLPAADRAALIRFLQSL